MAEEYMMMRGRDLLREEVAIDIHEDHSPIQKSNGDQLELFISASNQPFFFSFSFLRVLESVYFSGVHGVGIMVKYLVEASDGVSCSERRLACSCLLMVHGLICIEVSASWYFALT